MSENGKTYPEVLAFALGQMRHRPAPTTGPEKTTADNLREAIKALDAERSALVREAIEKLKPGRPFDSSVVRDINKLETCKNRVTVASFASPSTYSLGLNRIEIQWTQAKYFMAQFRSPYSRRIGRRG